MHTQGYPEAPPLNKMFYASETYIHRTCRVVHLIMAQHLLVQACCLLVFQEPHSRIELDRLLDLIPERLLCSWPRI